VCSKRRKHDDDERCRARPWRRLSCSHS
jgi:hypothetical protein